MYKDSDIRSYYHQATRKVGARGKRTCVTAVMTQRIMEMSSPTPTWGEVFQATARRIIFRGMKKTLER